ncbi:MAG: FHA domain-containing protein [Candidatus Hydrogenedens sp.]|nr:FHA domain-containing protein [Candidatus Hydrogenedens sp.]
MLQLTSKTGPTKGQAWPLVGGPIVLGRESKCDITIKDPLVSRKHCEIIVDNGTARVRDLGSSNATFVNGDSVEEAKLEPGDELSVGNAVFIVSKVGSSWELAQSAASHSPTGSMKFGQAQFLERDESSLFKHGKPRTAKDLAELFHTGRALGAAVSFDNLIENLLERVAHHLNPTEALVILSPRGKDQARRVIPDTGNALLSEKPSVESLVDHAIAEQTAGMLPELVTQGDHRVLECTLVAPLIYANETLGVLLVRALSPKRAYDEDDLELLIGIAHCASPNLKALEKLERLEFENERLVSGVAYHGPIIGTSEAINRVRQIARDCARSDLSVLILGETGTGKELVARLIHDLSPRAEKPLVIVNCAAIPDELFESEVFGHEAGAFTGATGRKIGLLEEANGGTLFLDEVGDLSPQNQARLLRAIETGAFRRLGGKTDLQVDVRVLSATNRDLGGRDEGTHFRRDLLHRLNAFELHLPPLRERRDDIPDLARHFLNKARQRLKAQVSELAPEALLMLQEHPWTGNIRELRNVIERAVVVAKGERVTPGDLFTVARAPVDQEEPEEGPFPTLAELERRHIIAAIERCEGNIKAAAGLLGIGRSTLYRKLGEYGISAG